LQKNVVWENPKLAAKGEENWDGGRPAAAQKGSLTNLHTRKMGDDNKKKSGIDGEEEVAPGRKGGDKGRDSGREKREELETKLAVKCPFPPRKEEMARSREKSISRLRTLHEKRRTRSWSGGGEGGAQGGKNLGLARA